MRRILVLFSLPFLLVCCKTAQEVSQLTVDEEIIVENFDEGIFFKLEKEGVEPSYLFGTINSIDHEHYVWGDNVEQAIRSSDRVVLERSTEYENLEELTDVSLLPENTTMKDYVSEQEYEDFVNFMQDSMEVSHRVFEGLYAKLKPIFLEQLAVVHYIGQNPDSYNNNISLIAENNNIELIGLESMADQIRFYDQIPLENQYAELIGDVFSGKDGEAKYKETIAAYQKKDLKSLEDLLSEEYQELPTYKTLMKERRQSWMPAIATELAKGNSFIAVGVGHFLGDDGLLSLIQQMGYTIEPIKVE